MYQLRKISILSTYIFVIFQFIINDRRILCLGLIQSLFEGSMYTFILEWTPVLEAAAEKSDFEPMFVFFLLIDKSYLSNYFQNKSDWFSRNRGVIPHGYVFSSFMICMMIGSSLFKLLQRKFRPESFLRFELAKSLFYL